ncbi:MAG: hypothetical protein E7Z84_05395 [Methanosphaera stadtmanae]|nr:hypothetical protein [Methanosphaera stadtmanae]
MDEKDIILITIIIISAMLLGLLIYHTIVNTPETNKNDDNVNNSAKIKINYVIFYSENNENHREYVTVNVGKENANKTVSMVVQFYNNKEIMNLPRYTDYKVDSEGNIKYKVTTRMSKYPNKSKIIINDGKKEITHSFNLKEKSGTQTLYV